MPVSPTFQQEGVASKYSWTSLQLTATLGTEESGHSREVAVADRLKQEWMYGLSAKKNDRCREVAVSGGSTVFQNSSVCLTMYPK